MKGEIPSYEVAKDNQEVYMDEKAREAIKQIQMAQL